MTPEEALILLEYWAHRGVAAWREETGSIGLDAIPLAVSTLREALGLDTLESPQPTEEEQR